MERGVVLAVGLWGWMAFATPGWAMSPEPPPSPDRVAARSIAILILSAEGTGYDLTELYNVVRRPLEVHTALRVAPLEAVPLDERDQVLRACAGDPGCFVRRLRVRRRADWLLTVSIDRSERETLVGLRLIDAQTGTQIGTAGDEVPEGMPVARFIEARLAELVPPSVWNQVGAIRIRSKPTSAEARAAGTNCVTPCAMERLMPGRYELELRKAGHELWKRAVDVEPGKTQSVEAELRRPSGSVFKSAWFWSAVGVGVAAAVSVSAVLLLQGSESEDVLCFAQDPAACEMGL